MTMTLGECKRRQSDCQGRRNEIALAADRWKWVRPIFVTFVLAAIISLMGWGFTSSIKGAILSEQIGRVSDQSRRNEERIDEQAAAIANIPEKVRQVVREELTREGPK